MSRAAVIGAGPSGFYASEQLLRPCMVIAIVAAL